MDNSRQEQLEATIAALEKSLQAGDPIELAALIEQFHLDEDPSAAVEVIYAEINWKRNRGELVDLDTYLEQFPQYSQQLKRLFHVDQVIELGAETYVQPDQTEDDSSESAAETTQAPETKPKTSKVIGPYKLLQEIGQGGMGTVYMAEQSVPVRRRVALKLVRSGIDSKEVAARFEAERQALALMDHSNIARVLDAGTTDEGVPYFVMELVRGIPITEYCDKYKLSIDDRLNLFSQACRAIQHAHQKGIIHRDVKPSNVLVAQYDDEPVVKVIDFGLAKALENTHRLTDKTLFTEFGQVVGTLQYMSPEQTEMNSLDVDTRSDVYSLGVLLYELLTGSTPIDRQTLKQMALDRVMAAIRDEEPQRPSQRLSNIGESATQISQQRKTDVRKLSRILKSDLDWINMKALEKDRKKRYESAAQLADDIKRYLTGDLIMAKPSMWGAIPY